MCEKFARLADGVPQREWLLRCSDERGECAVATLDVCGGKLAVIGPDEDCFFQLQDAEIAAFQRALNEAVAVAEEDLLRYAAQERAQTPAPAEDREPSDPPS